MKNISDVSLDSVKKARELIDSTIVRTPVFKLNNSKDFFPEDCFVKLENQQLTGSFKIRGALNRMNNLSSEQRKTGVIASSAGNHAQGVAYSATQLGVKSHIVMPENSPLVKILATQKYGGEVILKGEMYDDAYKHARFLEKEKGYFFVHPYQDPYVISGQGTIGLELLEQVENLGQVVIPIGGGGLISGISMVLKTLNPKIRVVGVVSAAAPGMKRFFEGEDLSKMKVQPTICDGIAVKNPSPEMYENFISKYVDEIVSVTDQEVSQGIVYLLEHLKTMTEGSGAAGFAALLSGKIKPIKNTCALLCGGNIDLNTVSRVIETGLRTRGRLARIAVVVDDLPGSLDLLTHVIAEKKANVLDVDHDRASTDLLLRQTRIIFTLETKSLDHVKEIKDHLNQMDGFHVD